MNNKNYSSLKDKSKKIGASLFGVADITPLKKDFHLSHALMKDLPYGISIGVRLSDRILEEIEDRPTKLYYHHYRQMNMLLDHIALRLTLHIQKEGHNAIPIPASQLIDWEKQTGHLSHKKVGQLAGIGWIGRNNLLVNPQHGARMRLVTVLTDMPLPTDKPCEEDCGDCKECIAVCPVNAIKERQEDFDHMKCYELLREFQKKGYVGQYICGICVKACKP